MVSVPVAFTPSFPALPQYVALAEGFYADHGLDVEAVQVTARPEMGAAMIGGDIIFAGAIPNNQITLIEAGFDVVAVAQQVSNQFFDIAVASGYDLGGATEWQDVMKALEGGNIGVVANGAAAEDIARTLFDRAGVDPDVQTYIATGLPDTTLASLLNQQVDAAISFDPLFVLAEQENAATQPFSLRAGEGPDDLLWPSLLVTTSREYAEENPDIVLDYIAATSEAIATIQDPAQRDRVLEIMTTDMGLPADVVEGMLDDGGESFTAGMEFDIEGLDRAGEWVSRSASRPRRTPPPTTRSRSSERVDDVCTRQKHDADGGGDGAAPGGRAPGRQPRVRRRDGGLQGSRPRLGVADHPCRPVRRRGRTQRLRQDDDPQHARRSAPPDRRHGSPSRQAGRRAEQGHRLHARPVRTCAVAHRPP